MDALLLQLKDALTAPQTAAQQAATEELIAALETGTVPWADVSPDFKDAHELPARDMGIDSASEEVAVQTKFRPQSGRVGAREIAMFLAAARLGPRPFGRCILATQEGVSLPAFRKSEYERLNIDASIRDKWARAAQEAEAKPLAAPIVLRDYQRAAIECVLERLHEAPQEESAAAAEDDDDGQSSSAGSEPGESVRQVRIKLPCGSGKTLIIAHIVKAAVSEGKRVVVLVPTLALLDQTSALFTECGIRHGLRGTDHNGRADCAAEEEVMISVYNSAAYLRGPFELIVVDEAHHLAVPEVYADDPGRSPTLWGEVRRLTANRPGPSSAAPLLAMFSATLDGADYERNTGDLITGGVLADYDIWVPVWDRNPEARDIAEYVAENIGALRSVLIYSNRLEKARAINAALGDLGIRSAYFDGESGRAERRRILDALRAGEIQALSTVGVVAEGADLPRANACVFADARDSQVAIVQCVGRALRKAPGKIMAHVVIPCVCGANRDDDSGLREMGRILRAMSGEDGRLRVGIARRGARVSVRTRVANSVLEENAVENAELISEYVYDRMGNMVRCGFERNLDILRWFVSANSRLPTQKEEYEGVKIGTWIHTIRQARKGKGNHLMTPERARALELIPGWSWGQAKTADEMFADNVALLQRFVSANSRLPTCREEYEGVKIGSWISTVRLARKGKGKSLMTPERAHALELIPGWSWGQAKTADEIFADNVALLQRFVSANSRLPTRKEEYGGVKIGAWISTVRTARKGKSSHLMTPERARALESIPGWKWNAR